VAFLMVLAVIFWAVGRGHAIHTEPTQAPTAPVPAPAPGQM
jgi:hypothetical protein